MNSRVIIPLVLFVVGCSTPTAVVNTFRPEHPINNAVIALISSGENTMSTAVERVFINNIDFQAYQFSMTNQNIEQIIADINKLHPSLLVTLGARATIICRKQLPELPLLFSLVQDDESGILSGENTAGVSLRLSPSTEFSLYRLALPDLKQLLTFYTPRHTESLVNQVRKEVEDLNFSLTALPINNFKDLRNTYTDHKNGMQGVWVFDDSNLMTRDAFVFLQTETSKEHQILLGSSLREFAAAGATMTVSINFGNVGGQLAAMANTVLKGTEISSLGVRPPIGGRLILNSAAARALGIELPDRALPFLSEVIDLQRR